MHVDNLKNEDKQDLLTTPFDGNSKNYGDTIRRVDLSKPTSVDYKDKTMLKIEQYHHEPNKDLFIEDDTIEKAQEAIMPEASIEVKQSKQQTPFKLAKNTTITAN